MAAFQKNTQRIQPCDPTSGAQQNRALIFFGTPYSLHFLKKKELEEYGDTEIALS